MVLHVPKLVFSSVGQELFLKRYLSPHEWLYMTENYEISPSSQSIQGNFIMTTMKPKHVFIYALNDAKLMNENENIFMYDTINLSNNRKLIFAQLEINGTYIPQEAYNPYSSLSILYRNLMSYNRSYDDLLTGSQLNIQNLKDLYPILYFDLRYLPELRSGVSRLNFKWQLDGVPDSTFSFYSVIFAEEKIKIVTESGKVFLKK